MIQLISSIYGAGVRVLRNMFANTVAIWYPGPLHHEFTGSHRIDYIA